MSTAVAQPPARTTLQPPLLAVKVVPGHEEDEALLRRTDLPAAGWVKRIYREGTKLKADFCEVPQEVEDAINRRAYRKISAEIYNDFADQGQRYGLVLRRVALLGAEVPQVKTLADIPKVADGEVSGVEIFACGNHRGREWTEADLDEIVTNFARLSADGTTRYCDSGATFSSILIFHEVRPVAKRFLPKPQQLRERALKFSDKARATLKLFADEPAPAADGSAPAAPEAATPEGMVALLTEWGCPPDVLSAVKEDKAALAALVDMFRAMQGGEAPKPDDAPKSDAPPPDAPPPQAGSQNSDTPPIVPAAPPASNGRQPQSVTLKYGDQAVNLTEVVQQVVSASLKPIQDQLSGAQSNITKFQADTKRSSIEAFCDRMKKDGKLLPAEEAQVKARLQRADAVAKFSDGRTELDLQMAEIEARPVLLKFSEQVKAGRKLTSADEEAAKVQRFAEEDQEFSSALKASGKTAEGYVAAFKRAREKDPKLTAAAYGVPPRYLA